jgi:hypothetical protein
MHYKLYIILILKFETLSYLSISDNGYRTVLKLQHNEYCVMTLSAQSLEH